MHRCIRGRCLLPGAERGVPSVLLASREKSSRSTNYPHGARCCRVTVRKAVWDGCCEAHLISRVPNNSLRAETSRRPDTVDSRPSGARRGVSPVSVPRPAEVGVPVRSISSGPPLRRTSGRRDAAFGPATLIVAAPAATDVPGTVVSQLSTTGSSSVGLGLGLGSGALLLTGIAALWSTRRRPDQTRLTDRT